jgi:sigma-B regulation protein RsbU (phosphoserine phosphatase)
MAPNGDESRNGTAGSALRVLVADDRADVLEALRLLLKSAGHKAETVDSPHALLRAAALGSFDLILMDLNYARDTTSGSEGLDLLDRLHKQENTAPVIVMTAWGNIDLAVEAMRRGACDFVQKPWDNTRLLHTLDRQAREGAERRRAERRARSEIEIARNVQQKLFPQNPGRLATADYAGRCVPAREVGGDYFDFLDFGAGAMGFVLADVSGKGIAAALLMANLQGCFRSQDEQRSPEAMLRDVNRLFCNSTPPEQYATVFFGRYDEASRCLQYVNCGHLPPILARAGGAIERLEGDSTVLGVFPSWECRQRTVRLDPGDTLVAFSDGVTEAGIDEAMEFGEERLIRLIMESRDRTVAGLVDAIVDAARGHSAQVQADDITVAGLRGT